MLKLSRIDQMKRAIVRNRLQLSIGLLVLLIPLFLRDDYTLHVCVMIFFYIILASSWNLLAGYAGQFSLAHAAFAGIGAYTSGLLAVNFNIPPAIGIFIGGGFAAMVGYLLGRLCLRMRAIYLVIATLGFGEFFRVFIRMNWEWTRGAYGLNVPLLLGTRNAPLYYYTAFALTVASLAVIYKILRSEIGVYLRSVREDEDAAAIMGIDIVKWKIFAFVVSSFFAGISGAFLVHFIGLVSPEMMEFSLMTNVMAMVITGGMGSFVGPIIGGTLLEFLAEFLREFVALRLILFALIMIIIMAFFRGGIAELLKKIRTIKWL